MPVLYLIFSVVMGAATSVFGKIYTRREGERTDSATLYTFLLLVSACLGWGVLYLIDFSFDARVLFYALLFGISYIAANLGIIQALKCGPATLTTLFVNLSLILVTVYGFFFWDEKLTLPVAIGLMLVCLAICLCLYTRKKEENAVSLKWIFYIAIAFVGNAACAVVQRTQQMVFDGQHGNMLMFFAILIAALFYAVIFIKADKRDAKVILCDSWWAPVLAALLNVGHNLFVLLLATTELSASLIYPVIGVGGLAIVTVFSLFVFKERMRWWQWLGVGVGAIAVVLLSI